LPDPRPPPTTMVVLKPGAAQPGHKSPPR
jgi:hypothetical protein